MANLDEHAKEPAKDSDYKNTPRARLFEPSEVEALKMSQPLEDRPHEEKEEHRAQKLIKQLLSELALDKPSAVIIRNLQERFDIYTDEGPKRVQFVHKILQTCLLYILGGRSHCCSMMKYLYQKVVTEALKQLKKYFEAETKKAERMLRSCTVVQKRPDPDPINVALNAGCMQVGYAPHQTWSSYTRRLRRWSRNSGKMPWSPMT